MSSMNENILLLSFIGYLIVIYSDRLFYSIKKKRNSNIPLDKFLIIFLLEEIIAFVVILCCIINNNNDSPFIYVVTILTGIILFPYAVYSDKKAKRNIGTK